jgi:two-component system, OmpR family, osmolarity sensor histidine kinase EnvZ
MATETPNKKAKQQARTPAAKSSPAQSMTPPPIVVPRRKSPLISRLPLDLSGLRLFFQRLSEPFGQLAMQILPKGLYARALLIILVPIVLLQSVLAFVFFERHWNQVTRRLSEATARDIAAIVELYENMPPDADHGRLIDLAQSKLALTSLQILPMGDLPSKEPRPFLGLLDRALSEEIRNQVRRDAWIDTVGQSNHVEIRIKLDTATLRFVAPRGQIYASNSHIFLVWMVGTSLVLISAAVLLLRNQIRPILRLAEAADSFGKGRGFPDDFKPRGAREVRQAAQAFVEMRDRITQHVEQRTTMLAGVSHDLRTVLTRFKLELALLGDTPEIDALKGDVNEMQHMLEDYLAFARGDGGESATQTNVRELLEEIHEDALHYGPDIVLETGRRRRELVVPLKRQALKRAILNLVSNAARFGDTVVLRATADRAWLSIDVEDDGPGIPKAERDNVFRAFYRLDHARNQDKGNTGLGLAIARDIARSHGGDISLDESVLGGLKATIRLPV